MKSKSERKKDCADYYRKNKAKFQASGRRWYPQNKRQVLARQKRKYPLSREDRLRQRLLITARNRAKKQRLPFNLSLVDIQVPSVCPILGKPLVLGKGKAHSGSPALDLFVPAVGYVGFNVNIISQKANSIKGYAPLEELRRRFEKQAQELADLEKVIRWMEKNNN